MCIGTGIRRQSFGLTCGIPLTRKESHARCQPRCHPRCYYIEIPVIKLTKLWPAGVNPLVRSQIASFSHVRRELRSPACWISHTLSEEGPLKIPALPVTVISKGLPCACVDKVRDSVHTDKPPEVEKCRMPTLQMVLEASQHHCWGNLVKGTEIRKKI